MLFVGITFICLNAQAQTVGLSISDIKIPPQYLSLKKEKLHLKSSFDIDNQQVVNNKPRPIPTIFSVETLPFFCKIEYKLGLNNKLPVKFRLGDVQYVEQLEGKH
jgi:hypothetical protein